MQFNLLQDEHNYQRLLEHRFSVYDYANLHHLTRDSPLVEKEYHLDEISHVFYGTEKNEIIASCRLTQVSELECSFKEKLAALCPDLNIGLTFLISRLCVNSTYHGRKLYIEILKSVCSWAKENYDNQFYIARCRSTHAVLYQLFGCKEIPGSLYYDELAGAEYILLKGNIEKTYNLVNRNN